MTVVQIPSSSSILSSAKSPFLRRHRESSVLSLRSVSVNPEAKSAYLKGKSLHGRKMFDEAINAYKDALVSDPTFHTAAYGIASCLGSLGQHDEAIQAYDHALNLDDAK
jgi:tetratricopeptide (TPR) repeat protein